MPKWHRRPVQARPAWRGAAIAVAVATAVLFGWSTADQVAGSLDVSAVRLVATDVAVGVVAGGAVSGLVALTLGRVVAVSWSYLWVTLTALVLLGTSGAGASRRGWWTAVVVVLVGTSLVGAALGRLLADGEQARRDRRMVVALAAGLLVLGGPGLWLATAGGPAPDTSVADPAMHDELTSAGPFAVEVADYGTGSDQRRRFGTDVDVVTEPVDASGLLEGWSQARRSRWGFDPTGLPLNARVWHPTEPGSFPLVLVVHGNLSAAEDSELGFDYLAEQVASHGFVVATIDQNFLNTAFSDRAGGLTGAMETRGWLVLEHLRAWQRWAQDSDHPLGGLVDLDRVGLLGHSRGGEAVAAATFFAQRGSIPGHDDVDVFDSGGIESVVALAPSDGQYRPDDVGIPLEDVDYLVLQGSHDADVGSFVGLEQYERVTFTDGSPRTKAAVYVARANHAQFNRGWGRHDVGNGLPKHFLDTTALLPAKDQRDIAGAYTSAFLRQTLGDDDTLQRLLDDPSRAEAALPTPDLVTRYTHTGTDRLPAMSPASTDGGPTELRWPGPDGEGVLTAEVPDDLEIDEAGHLVLDAVALDEDSRDLEVTVQVTDRSGASAEVSLTADRHLQGVVPGRYLKGDWLHAGDTTEPVLQTYAVPIADLSAANRDLRADELAQVSVHLGRADERDTDAGGAVLIGDLGLSNPRQ